MGNYKEVESIMKYPITCIYGESGSGKTTYAKSIKPKYKGIILDGDSIRKYITYNLGYSENDRKKNNEIIANIAELLYNQGFKVIISTVRADIAYNILTQHNIECKLFYVFNDHKIKEIY